MAASLSWFLIVIATEIVMMVVGVAGWSHSLAVMLFVGVLTQLVLAVLGYVGPMLRGGTSDPVTGSSRGSSVWPEHARRCSTSASCCC